MKRLFDIILSSILLISLLPILIIISILIFLLNGYPIIFSQSRPGLNNGLFKIYKFRTMINIKNNSMYTETKRITTFGVIVNTSFNVRGEPIVNSPEDAFKCFMNTEMDVLVCGSYIFLKEDHPHWEKEVLSLND